MPIPSELTKKLISAIVPILASRQTRQALGLTPARPLGPDYDEILDAVSARIQAASWIPPDDFEDDDRVVVYWYSLDRVTASGLTFRDLNLLLRTGKHANSAGLWLLAAYLYEAVSKLPSRSRESYRVAKPFKGFDSIYTIGNRISEPSFVSASRNPRSAFEGDLYFSIRGKSGRNLAPCAHYKMEDEILFLPGSTFDVLDIEELTDGSIHITLQEV